MQVGTLLTDNADDYEVLDMHLRHGVPWVKLENTKFQGNAVWFPLADAGELGIKGQRSRRGPARIGGRRG